HEVARIEEGARNQVKPLLRPVHDQDVLGARLEAEAEEIAREVLTKRSIAARWVVLEELSPLLTDHAIEHPTESVGGEEGAVPHPARKGTDPGGGARHLAVGAAPSGIGRHDLRRLGEMAGPLEARGGRGRRCGGRLLGYEGALPHVRTRPTARNEILVSLGD